MSSFTTVPANPWMRVLGALEKKVNRTSYETWLKPTRFDHSQGRVLFVRVPNPEFCHIGERYGDLISEAIDDLGLEFQDVEFVTDEPQQGNGKAVRAAEIRHDAPGRSPSALPKPTIHCFFTAVSGWARPTLCRRSGTRSRSSSRRSQSATCPA